MVLSKVIIQDIENTAQEKWKNYVELCNINMAIGQNLSKRM